MPQKEDPETARKNGAKLKIHADEVVDTGGTPPQRNLAALAEHHRRQRKTLLKWLWR